MDTILDKDPNNSNRLTHIENNCIVVDYPFQDEGAMYDLCDLSGSILISGKLIESMSIDVATLPKGVYVFHIIDNGNVRKERIQV